VLRTRRDSYNDLEPELEESFLKYEPASPDDEEVYHDTLLDELKQLQDMYNVVLQEKQNEEAQRIKLNQVKNKLEHQVQQLNEVGSIAASSYAFYTTPPPPPPPSTPN
jgi:hypothetical protein